MQVRRNAQDQVLWQFVQPAEGPQPGATGRDRLQLVGETELRDQGDRFGTAREEPVGSKVDGSPRECGRCERTAEAVVRFEDFDARSVGCRSTSSARELPGGGESSDAPADDDDRRSAHLLCRLADDVREDGREHRVVVERRGAHEIEADLARDALGLDVKIKEHL